MYKSQDPITNTIEITRTIYPPARSPLIGSHSWDVDCQIRINGKEEYHTVTSFVLYQKTAPWMFEQWLLTGNELFEQGKRRDDRRSYGCNFMRRIKLACRKFIGKFVDLHT